MAGTDWSERATAQGNGTRGLICFPPAGQGCSQSSIGGALSTGSWSDRGKEPATGPFSGRAMAGILAACRAEPGRPPGVVIGFLVAGCRSDPHPDGSANAAQQVRHRGRPVGTSTTTPPWRSRASRTRRCGCTSARTLGERVASTSRAVRSAIPASSRLRAPSFRSSSTPSTGTSPSRSSESPTGAIRSCASTTTLARTSPAASTATRCGDGSPSSRCWSSSSAAKPPTAPERSRSGSELLGLPGALQADPARVVAHGICQEARSVRQGSPPGVTPGGGGSGVTVLRRGSR